jgi:hypothetical protein
VAPACYATDAMAPLIWLDGSDLAKRGERYGEFCRQLVSVSQADGTALALHGLILMPTPFA